MTTTTVSPETAIPLHDLTVARRAQKAGRDKTAVIDHLLAARTALREATR